MSRSTKNPFEKFNQLKNCQWPPARVTLDVAFAPFQIMYSSHTQFFSPQCHIAIGGLPQRRT